MTTDSSYHSPKLQYKCAHLLWVPYVGMMGRNNTEIIKQDGLRKEGREANRPIFPKLMLLLPLSFSDTLCGSHCPRDTALFPRIRELAVAVA